MWTFWNEQFYSNEQTSVRQLPETLDILVVHLHLNKWLDPWENFWLVAGGWGSLKCSLVGHLTTWTANITGKFDQNFSKKWDAWACTEAVLIICTAAIPSVMLALNGSSLSPGSLGKTWTLSSSTVSSMILWLFLSIPSTWVSAQGTLWGSPLGAPHRFQCYKISPLTRFNESLRPPNLTPRSGCSKSRWNCFCLSL